MTYKELMTESLTDLLEEGETLLYPIYGILNQGNTQYYAYFGFAGNDLLIALLAGKQVAYTTRVPLDIKSVKIKQTAVFKQYVIDISFVEGAPCRIKAAPKVMVIDSQKENLPLFLEFLKSKTPKLQTAELREAEGKKIRRQYFNIFIYILLAFLPMPIIAIVSSEIAEGRFQPVRLVEILPTGGVIWFIALLPVIILSLLNRFLFGKTVCVFGDDGLVLENDFIRWDEIEEIEYCPRLCSRFKTDYTFATVAVKPQNKSEYSLNIMHFPRYALKAVKRYNPKIKIKTDKDGIHTILFMALMPTVISLIISLFYYVL